MVKMVKKNIQSIQHWYWKCPWSTRDQKSHSQHNVKATIAEWSNTSACQDAEVKDCSGFGFRGRCNTTQSCSYSSVTSFFVPMKQQYQSFAFSESRKVILLFSWGKVAKIICRWQLKINKMVKTVKYCWQLSGQVRLMQRKWTGLMAFSGVN